MEKLAFVLVLAFFVPVILIVVFFLVFMRLGGGRDMRVPFECGFDSKSSARIPFSLQFFLLAVVFLIFDVEVALLFPLCYAVMWQEKLILVCVFFSFMVVVLGGLLVEWVGGALDWIKG
jgi:NADH-ubiquinone oxidoreductase chain 3